MIIGVHLALTSKRESAASQVAIEKISAPPILWNGISAMFDPVIHRPRTNAVAALDYSSADQPLPSIIAP